MIIADITRAFVGSEYSLVHQAVTRSLATKTKVVVVFNETQRPRVPSLPEVIPFLLNGWSNADQIAAKIRDEILFPEVAANASEQIEILSFHPPVLNITTSLRP